MLPSRTTGVNRTTPATMSYDLDSYDIVRREGPVNASEAWDCFVVDDGF